MASVCRQFLCVGGRGLLEQQFHRFLSAKYPQYQLGAEVGGARKRKQSAPRKAYHFSGSAKRDQPSNEDKEETTEVTQISDVVMTSSGAVPD